MMEGISAEAASLAGHLKLSNLCWIYDNNHITIEGNTALAFSEDVATRFLGYGWNVTRVGDANDLEMLARAFRTFLSHERPADADHRRQPHRLRRPEQAGHQRRPRRAAGRGGDPADQAATTAGRRTPSSSSPTASTTTSSDGIGKRGKELRDAWFARVKEYRAKYPELADQFYRMQHRQLPDGWDKDLPTFPADAKGLATRDASGQGAQRARQERALADGRLGRPGPVDQDAADVRRGRRLRRGQSRRPQPPLRHPRARHGGRPQRHGPGQGAAVRVGLPDLQRLRRRRSGSAPSWRCRSSTSSRTTRSASARTGRRTSRSSSSRRCGPFPA